MRGAGLVLAVAVAAFAAWPSSIAAAVTPRVRALELLDAGEAPRARATLDSVLAAEPFDGTAAYWAARAVEESGEEAAARCRYLRVEGAWPGSREALLAEWRQNRTGGHCAHAGICLLRRISLPRMAR